MARTSIAAAVGGTASEIGGGTFANGAVSGAFVHLFNAETIKALTTTKATDALENAYEYYEGRKDLESNLEFVSNLRNLGDALRTNNLSLAAESYAGLYDYIPVPISIVPVSPEAITGAIDNINAYNDRQMNSLRSLCGNNASCIQQFTR